MREPNQGTREPSDTPAMPEVAVEGVETRSPSSVARPERRPDLRFWLYVVAVAGIGALALGHAELAALTVVAGLFAVAHAADLDPAREAVYLALAWIVPAGALFTFASLGLVLVSTELGPMPRAVGLAFVALGALFSVGVGLRPSAHVLARFLFRVPETSHVLRLAGRLAVMGVLLCVPASFAFPLAAKQIERGGGALVGAGSLWGNLIGLTALALGGVGFQVRRDTRATLARLGIEPLRLSHALVVVLGVAALVVLNAGAETLQQAWFPGLWARDQRVNQMIVGSLTRGETLLLGLSAGVGEELALRGALQPRLGTFRTAALFAVLHVQYSWFGIAIIAMLGLLLGWVRQRTSTSVAIAVHALYDVVAVMSLRS